MSKQIDEKTAAALADLGVTEDEIAELAEKAKALPQEENVVEKEAPAEPTLINKLKQLIGIEQKAGQAPVASLPEEARKADEVSPANDAEPVEEVKAVEPEPDAEMFKQMGAALAEAMKAELDKRDEQIEALTEQVKALSGTIEEKVEARLADMPPVTKVAASMVGATAVDAPEAQKGQTYVGALMGDITRRTEKMLGGKPDKMEV